MTDYKSLPKSPGVYFFKNRAGKIIYVGKARNLRERVKSYFQTGLESKTAALVSEIKDINFIEVESEVDAFLLEANQIRKFAPRYNLVGKDGKNFPLIEISVKDEIPTVRLVHQETNPAKKYFGPYPTGSNIGSLLRYLRRVFPFVSQKHSQNRPCLYSHLGLCPCANLPEYPSNLKNLVAFLSGQRKSLQKDLEAEMKLLAKNKKFEQAAEIKNKLDQIAYITSAKNRPWQYEQNPNLVSDQRNAETQELKKILKFPKLERIEAYDISNTAGKQATGAMVTFINGQPEKKFYRRYKIKKIDTPDDCAMLAEVVSRRLGSDIPLPDLIVVDGGKGQVDAIATLPHDKNITIIGLAKRLETIVLSDGREINLPTNSPALHLLQRLRDEAHRFSRKYHVLLRSKKMLE